VSLSPDIARQAATVGQYSDLKGKPVFITGGESGIGAAVTEAFISQEANVTFVQRSDAASFCEDVKARHGVAPHFIPCDITDVPALQEAMRQTAEIHAPVDVLVNNAANDQRH
jgi:NAD(P)-dependent dehydrogenase (short-subunit alcohol dehydrogenase family)